MNLQETISKDLVQSMKSKDADRLSTLRLVKSALTNAAIEKKKDALTDEEVLAVIQKQVKQRHESLENFQKGNRTDLANKEKKEIEILSSYLPKPFSPQELEAMVRKAIEQSQAKTKADLGKVMKVIMPQLQGRADGKQVTDLLGKLLGA